MPRAPHASRRASRRPRALLVLLLAVLPFAVAHPAVAHDGLVASTPADGAMLTAVPAAVELTYSAEILPAGVVVEVRDPQGTNRAVGTPTVAGTTVSTAVDAAAPGGAYTVVWRVVSSDGHPIEGSFGFTLAVPTPTPTATATPTPTPTSAPTAPAATATLSTPDGTVTGLSAGVPRWVVLVLAVAGAGAVAAAAIVVARRRS